jgi:sialic acid synthase SpsE
MCIHSFARVHRSILVCKKVEEGVKEVARRSLAAREHVPKGTVLQHEHLIALRPTGGICPSKIDQVG